MYRQDDLEDEESAIEDYLYAEELLEEIAERTGDESLPERMLLIHLRLGPIYLHRGEWEDAIRHFEFVLEENPESAGIQREIALAHHGMGNDQFQEGLLSEAQESFRKAFESFEAELEVSPANQLTLYDFGEFLLDPEVRLDGIDQSSVSFFL